MASPVTHVPVATPNPQIIGLRVQIKSSILASNPNIIPPEGTLYSEFSKGILGKDWIEAYANYKYIQQERGETPPGTTEGSTFSLLFLPTMTNAQRNTPYRTLSKFGNFEWDPILNAIVFIADRNFPRSTNGVRGGRGALISGPSYYNRQSYQPGVNRGTRFILQYFFSDVPYNIPSYLVPIPRAIYFSVPGTEGYFPSCLGPRIQIPNTQTASAAFVAGSTAFANGALKGQDFPATNYEGWTPYFSSDEQQFDNGYSRLRTFVIPPLVDDTPNIK